MKYAACFISLGLSLLAGCVTEPVPYYQIRRTQPGGLTFDEILKMSKTGSSDAIIIEKIKSAGVATKPSAEQLAYLKKEGLSDDVLKAITDAPIIVPKESVETVYQYPYAYPYSYPYAYYGYYGYPYYYGPYQGAYWYRYPYYRYRAPYYPYHYRSTFYPVRGGGSVHTYRK